MQFLSLALLVSSASAAAIQARGDNWNSWEKQSTVTVYVTAQPEKQIEYKTVTEWKEKVVPTTVTSYTTEYKEKIVPTTVYVTSYQEKIVPTTIYKDKIVPTTIPTTITSYATEYKEKIVPTTITSYSEKVVPTTVYVTSFKEKIVPTTVYTTAYVTAAPVKEYLTVTLTVKDTKTWGDWQ